MNIIKQTKVKEGMHRFKSNFIIGSLGVVTILPSCVQPRNGPVVTAPSIEHSEPGVHSLLEHQNTGVEEEAKSGFIGFIIGGIFDSLLGSDPDSYRSGRGDSDKGKRKFLRENRDEIVRDLESKAN